MLYICTYVILYNICDSLTSKMEANYCYKWLIQHTLECCSSFCRRSVLSQAGNGGEPIWLLTFGGKTVLNSFRVNFKLTMAPTKRPQIFWYSCCDCSRRPAAPPVHLVVPSTSGPKKTASNGPGDILLRQLSLLELIHAFEFFGTLQHNSTGLYFIKTVMHFNCNSVNIVNNI